MIPYQKLSGLPNQWGMRSASGSGRKARLPEIRRIRISRGIAAEDVDVGDRQKPKRQEAPAGKLAQQRQEQSPEQRQDRGHEREFEA